VSSVWLDTLTELALIGTLGTREEDTMPEPVRYLDLTVDKDKVEANAVVRGEFSAIHLESDGTVYKIVHYNGEIPKPLFFEEFVGAIAEWCGGLGKPTVALYRSEEVFGHHYAAIDSITTRAK